MRVVDHSVRPLYILEKITATLGTFSLIYIVTQSYIWEVMPKPGDSFLSAFGTLVLPFMINYLLVRGALHHLVGIPF